MSAEQARAEVLRTIDAVLDGGFLARRFVTAGQRRLLRAQRRYWQDAPPAELERFGALLDQEPAAVAPLDTDAEEGE